MGFACVGFPTRRQRPLADDVRVTMRFRFDILFSRGGAAIKRCWPEPALIDLCLNPADWQPSDKMRGRSLDNC